MCCNHCMDNVGSEKGDLILCALKYVILQIRVYLQRYMYVQSKLSVDCLQSKHVTAVMTWSMKP